MMTTRNRLPPFMPFYPRQEMPSQTYETDVLRRTSAANALKEEALSLLYALYGPQYSPECTFDVLTGVTLISTGQRLEAKHVARGIVYLDKDLLDWKICWTGTGDWTSYIRCLEEFVRELKIQFGKAACKSDMFFLYSYFKRESESRA
ncbi:hypothetical protein GQ44DRAFT_722720 [Phaeosphaeriaceae sp. PMI808]|nr:hypothetical protein GQ44DRAFT_722720 [Phaeosphaeriaceae sp. PMI808]